MTDQAVYLSEFLPFYRHVVGRERIAAELGGVVAAVAAPGSADRLVDTVWEDLLTSVEGHSFRMLIGEFHAFRVAHGLPADGDGDAALRRFTGELAPGALLDRHPVLRDRLAVLVENTTDAYGEVLADCAADRPGLHRAGLLDRPDQTVTGLFATGGDPHNGHRTVVGVEFAGGRRLMHKPRPLTSDRFTAAVLAAAGPYLRHPLDGCLPASVILGGHGWQQYVRAADMTEEDQPARYFYRFGALCALLGAVGASDLHDENLLATGEHPCVVDTETVLRPDSGVADDSLPHRLINQLKLSVAATMLVPMVDPRSHHDLLMAGVGIEEVQQSRLTRPVVEGGGTDAIAVRWKNVVYRHQDNVPRVAGVAVSPLDHFADITAGYLDALAAVRSGAVAAVLDGHADMPVRCVLRSTFVYSRFLDAASHPDYLADPAEADRLLRLLSPPGYFTPDGAAYVGEREQADLGTGNVPYFFARAGSRELATAATRFPAAHRVSPLDVARHGLALNGAAGDAYHRFLLEECFGEVAADRPAGLSRHGVFTDGLATAGPGAWWPGIARTMAAVGITHHGPAGAETGWLGGIGPDRGSATVTPGTFVSFHDHGGIAAFLAHAARYDGALADAAAAAGRGLTTLTAEYRAPLDAAPEGLFTGAAGRLLLRPDDTTPAAVETLVTAIEERAGTAETDLANGPAGVLMLLLSLPVDTVGADALDRLHTLVRTHATLPRTAPWYDVAHGELGLRWALARAGRALGDPAGPGAAADWLAARLAEDDGPPGTGWCAGRAGLLLAAAEISTAADRPVKLGPLADAATRLPDGTVDVSVCHGSSGVVQCLVATARLLDDLTLLDRAEDYQRRVLTTARRRGLHTGSPGRTSLLGYLLGWAGIGDTDLLLHAALTGTGRPAVPAGFLSAAPRGVLQ